MYENRPPLQQTWTSTDSPFDLKGEYVSLSSLKDLTDSDPEPSTIERLGAGPGSGFKWESSVGETPFPPSLPYLSVLPSDLNLWLKSPTTADLSLLTCLVLTLDY